MWLKTALQQVSMKRAAGIFLLACITFPFWGSYCLLIVSRQVIKKEVRQQLLQGMNKEDLILLAFTRQQTLTKLRWEHDREFAYHGTMYDVVESTFREDSCFFLCYPDHRETALNREIAALVEKCMGRSPVQKDNQKTINRLLHLTYLCVPFSWYPTSPEAPSVQPCRTLQRCLSGVSDPPDHPPKA